MEGGQDLIKKEKNDEGQGLSYDSYVQLAVDSKSSLKNAQLGCGRLSSSTEIVEPIRLPNTKFAEIEAKVVCIYMHSIGTVTIVKQKLSLTDFAVQREN